MSSEAFLLHIKARWEPPGWQMPSTQGCVLQLLCGMHPGPGSKQGWGCPDVFVPSLPMHPKAKMLRCPWKSAPVFATNCCTWCRAQAGAVSSVLPPAGSQAQQEQSCVPFQESRGLGEQCMQLPLPSLPFPAAREVPEHPSTLHRTSLAGRDPPAPCRGGTLCCTGNAVPQEGC